MSGKYFAHLYWIDAKPQVGVMRRGRIRRYWPVTQASVRRVLRLWDRLSDERRKASS